ncbi:endonuclease/exonuclease/phosphatase family domain-containing protein 1-like [Glandiceps talaboti]
MGNNMITTCCGRCPKKSRLRSDYDLIPHIKGHRRDISATYSAKDLTFTFNKLNINAATQEELMTLPGISRIVAKNIVDYRQQIGGFRKVEDLALVTGVGAVKLAHMRPEICISSKNGIGTPRGSDGGISRSSSATGSRFNPSVQQPQYTHTQPTSKYTDINTATVSQLSRINDIGEHRAKKIIHYRNTHGPFHTYDEIKDIPGIGQETLDQIQDQITLGEMEYLTNHADFSIGDAPRRKVQRSNSRNSGTQTDFQFLDIQPSSPPTTSEVIRDFVPEFTGIMNGLPVIRVGTWNLSRFSKDKASNCGVMEVVCRTILENGLSLIAFQELLDQGALIMVCNELNNPTLPNVLNWTGHRGMWECQISEVAGRINQSLEYNGFLWDKSRGITMKDSWLMDQVRKPKHQQFTRQPYIGIFLAAKLEVVIISLHLKPSDVQDQSKDKDQADIKKLPYLIESLQTELPGVNDIIITGDFSIAPSVAEFSIFKNYGFTNVVTDDTFTNITTLNPEGSYSHDNIWLSKGLQQIETGEMGIIRQGLQHPCIPDGWKWNGLVSEHCPVWTEMYVNGQLKENGETDKHQNTTNVDSGTTTTENHITYRHPSYKAMLNGDIDGSEHFELDTVDSSEDIFLEAMG